MKNLRFVFVTLFVAMAFGIVHRVGIEFVDLRIAKFTRLQSLGNLFDQVPIDRLIQPLISTKWCWTSHFARDPTTAPDVASTLERKLCG